ncbi:DMT family transporter [Acidovorax carolinensis]|nr:DMT family transporter [Acidovorax carolinensis]
MGPKTSAAVATILWGFTYVVSTTLLPHNPLLVAAVRALGGAFALLLFARHLPPPGWWNKLIVLGTLNAGLFFALLFISAMRLPGGVAAIFQALGPLFAILLGWAILKMKPSLLKIASVLIGVVGVALVVLKGNAGLDAIGIAAALGGTLSLALGGVLMNKWGKPPISMLAFTGWQLLVAGIELLLVALLAGDLPTVITVTHIAGFVILAVLLTAVPFVLWFGAIARAGMVVVAPFFLLVPITAFVLDALIKGFVPTGLQIVGAVIVVAGLLLSQWTPKARRKHSRKVPQVPHAKHS